MLYERESGITEADGAKAAADAKEFANFDKVTGDIIGPIPSKDGKALQTIVIFDMGVRRLGSPPRHRRRPQEDRRAARTAST